VTDALRPLTDDELTHVDAWWRAPNYLSGGQICLMGNPLLREPLRPEHVKPRLLGPWGTTPGSTPSTPTSSDLGGVWMGLDGGPPLQARGEVGEVGVR
jgi:phosphoketolase